MIKTMTIHLHDDVVRTGVVTELEVFHRGLKKIKKIFAENFTRIFTFFMEKNMCRGSHFPLCESFNLKEILFLNLNHFELFDLGKSLFSSFCIQPQRLVPLQSTLLSFLQKYRKKDFFCTSIAETKINMI